MTRRRRRLPPPRRRRYRRPAWSGGLLRRRRLVAGIGAAVVVLVVAAALVVGRPGSGGPPPIAPKGTHGYDVSWPQCSGPDVGTMPAGSPPYLILGLTDGAGHTVNPCLAAQLDWARSHGSRVGAYLVVTYPTPAELAQAATGDYGACGTSMVCRLHNDGAAQAEAALQTLTLNHLAPPRVWLDVEVPTSRPWSDQVGRNVAVLQGAMRGLRSGGFPVGVYTTSALWEQVVGAYQLDVPNWLPSGNGNPHDAQAKCTTSATGGPTWLVQYTQTLDSDLTCPVLGAARGHHGPLWPYRLSTQSQGATGPAVRALQEVVGVPVTGTFDAATVTGVSSWQTAHQLTATGTVTPVDWRAMGAYRVLGRHGFLLARIASPLS